MADIKNIWWECHQHGKVNDNSVDIDVKHLPIEYFHKNCGIPVKLMNEDKKRIRQLEQEKTSLEILVRELRLELKSRSGAEVLLA